MKNKEKQFREKLWDVVLPGKTIILGSQSSTHKPMAPEVMNSIIHRKPIMRKTILTEEELKQYDCSIPESVMKRFKEAMLMLTD